MEREYKSKVGWWYHLVIIMVVIGCVAAFLRTNISVIVGMMVAALGVLHVFFNTYYRITEDDMLIRPFVGSADHMEQWETLDAHISDQPG